MVSIIKNQLLKHLSRYTKNLSSDKINLSTFRGEGELSNLQLDENVLTDLLELPSWLRLTSAWCNHVSFRISWTKLKSVPITLTLDEVNITVETCELQSHSRGPDSGGDGPASPTQTLQVPQGKYSFIHKVIDGITIIVNTVNVKFISPAFIASVQMSRIRVESKTPKWLSADLRVTRLKDPQKGILLIFKELSWQTVRIEASSTQDTNLTPLRLLTNQARCRITIRKKLSDCSVLASRLVLILDDLLWVLTDSQLKAALHFVDSLSGLIKASTHETQKTKAQKKFQNLQHSAQQSAQQSHKQTDLSQSATTTQKMFHAFDVRETSYHFFSQRIDLHLCDDEGDGRSIYPDLKDGGALQVSIQAFQVDYYPYHLAKSDRTHWAKYKEASVPPSLWLEQSLNQFRESLLNLCQPNRPASHAPLERCSMPASPGYVAPPQSFSSVPVSGPSTPIHQSGGINTIANKAVLDNLAKLMSACVILRIEDFTLYRVTTSGKKQMPKEFVAGDKDRFSFPPDMPIIHAEFTYFYYPGDFIFPLPPSKIFCYINPLQIHFDLFSILWFNSFALNLHESLLRTSVVASAAKTTTNDSPHSSSSIQTTPSEPSLMYMDVKIEAIMPRIVIESSIDVPSQRDRPKLMQIQIARFAMTNIREMGSSRADLAQALHSLQEGSLVFGSGFPSVNGDLCIVTDRILSHVAASDVPSNTNNYCQQRTTAGSTIIDQTLSNLSRYAMWAEPRDVWCIKLDPMWIDFIGARSLGPNKAIPFVDAVPITLWLHGESQKENLDNIRKSFGNDYHTPLRRDSAQSVINTRLDFANSNFTQEQKNSTQSLLDKTSTTSTETNIADMHAIAHVSNLVSVQIDHYQFLFLLRLAEEMTELSTFLSLDAERILQKQNTKKSLIFGCVIPQVEVTLVMPSATPGKESSGGDAESVIPDSASLGDDLHMNSTNTTWPQSLDHIKNTNPFSSVDTPSPLTNDPPFDNNGIHISNPNPRGYNVQIQSTPTVASSTISQSSRQDTGIFSQSVQSSVGPPSNKSTSGGHKSRNSITDTNISKELNSGFMSMKKGFSSFMTSIDTAIKSGGINDDASDTFSVYSDVSSDSENFAIVMADDKTTDCIDVMFKLNPFTTDSTIKASPVEVASEVYEEPNSFKTNMSSPSEPSDGSCWRRRDLVSMATFRLTTVEVIRQNEGYKSSLKLQVSAISCDECGAIPWDELQTKFGARCRAWNLAAYNPEAPPSFQLRLEEILNPPKNLTEIEDKKSIQSWFTHHADIRLKDLTMDLSMSTVIGLGDLTEDEIITTPLPLNICLENVKINLIEDRPPINITSPGPVPINLAITKLFIKRDETGTILIQPTENNGTHLSSSDQRHETGRGKDREMLSIQLIMQQLKLDNETLRKQLINTRESAESLRLKNRQENETLRSYLKAAQDDIANLLDEKKTLLDTVRSLQQQLTYTDLNKKADGNR